MAGQIPLLQPAAFHLARIAVSSEAFCTCVLHEGHGSENGAVAWHCNALTAGLQRLASAKAASYSTVKFLQTSPASTIGDPPVPTPPPLPASRIGSPPAPVLVEPPVPEVLPPVPAVLPPDPSPPPVPEVLPPLPTVVEEPPPLPKPEELPPLPPDTP
jgi:hypothetical protein